MAGNRTRINCLEGNYAHHYTTIAAYAEVLAEEYLLGATSTFSVFQCNATI